MKELSNYVAGELAKLDRGIVATPSSWEKLEKFAEANHGSNDMLLMQMAVNFGYKLALENMDEVIG